MSTKKLIKALGLIIVVALLAAALPLQVKAQEEVNSTITVCASGCNYTTIQAAIDAASAGDTVEVGPGTYYGAIMINKPLTLISKDGPQTTILHGGMTAESTLYVVSIRASNVTLSGFTVTSPKFNSAWGGDPAGIMIGYYGDNTLSNIKVTNNIVTLIGDPARIVGEDGWPSTGICINGVVNGLEIDHNIISEIHQTVDDPDVTWGPVAIGYYGYDTTPLSQNVNIHDNTIFNISATKGEGTSPISLGIAAGWGSGSATIANNNIHHVDGRAIQASSSNNGSLQITGNTLYENSVGVYLNNTGLGTLRLNKLLASNGIAVQNLITSTLDATKNWWGAATGPAVGAVSGNVDYDPWCTDEHCVLFRMKDGGDRLAEIQNNDGGWDWFPADDSNPASTSPLNTLGPTAKGLADAYLRNYGADQLAALQTSGQLLLTKNGNFSATDYELAMLLDQIFGVSTYTQYVKTNFYDLLAAGTYSRKGVTYNTQTFVQAIRDGRSGTIASIAAWDLGLHLVSAKYAGVSGADLQAWIDGLKAEINEIANDDYEVIGLAGAVYGLGFAGIEFDPTSGLFADADSTADLAAALAGYQIDGGGFTWDVNSNEDGEQDIQTTAYAIMALNAVDREGYLAVIQGAANYLLEQQLINGGWAYLHNGTVDEEYNEVTGEVLSAIAVTYPVNSDDVLNILKLAPENSTVFFPAGVYSFSGGYTINTNGLTIVLEDGAVIRNASPCFTVAANNVTITSETIGGGKCVPTDEDDGIVVNDGVQGLRIVGLEIDGTGQETGDGIHFNGAITNFQIVNNFIHDLDGNAINFVGTPGGEPMDIQGNLFKAVLAPAIVTTIQLNAEYNSWGQMDAPSITKVDTDPNTHVKVSVVSSNTPWANQVVAGNTITYTVKADLKNITGAEITLLYPSGISISGDVTKGGTFNNENVSIAEAGKIVFSGFQTPQNGQPIVAVSGEGKVLFTVTFTVPTVGTYPLSFDLAADNFAMAPASGPSNYVYADSLTGATIKGITLPNITSVGMEGYYLTGEYHEFTVTTVNPDIGGDYQHVIFPIEITAGSDDGVVLEVKSGETWIPISLDCTSVSGKCTGSFGLEGGFHMPAPYNVTTTFRATASNADSYPIKVQLIDLDAGSYVLTEHTKTAVVYLKPTITSPDLVGSHQGLTQTFTVNVDNMSNMVVPGSTPPTPITFLLHFDGLPEGAKVKIGSGSEVTCGPSGCDVPVTLNAGSNPLSVHVVFPANFDDDVSITLYDSLADPYRPLQSALFSGVKVYANIPSVTGTVSMQGRTYRGGVLFTLTGQDGFTFGPYTATSIDQINNNVVFANLASGTYTITVTQPRYLDVTAGLGAEIDLGTSQLISALELKAGDANDDETIDSGDAAVVGYQYKQPIFSNGDINFDGTVNIQDLALVGSNYTVTSATAYAGWMGIPDLEP